LEHRGVQGAREKMNPLMHRGGKGVLPFLTQKGPGCHEYKKRTCKQEKSVTDLCQILYDLGAFRHENLHTVPGKVAFYAQSQ
jgi:hypothetical protein